MQTKTETPIKKTFLSKTIITLLLVISVLLLLQVADTLYTTVPNEVSYTEFINDYTTGQITELKVTGRKVSYVDNKRARKSSTVISNIDPIVEKLTKKGIPVYVSNSDSTNTTASSIGLTSLIALLPVFVLIIAMFWLSKKSTPRGDHLSEMGKSRARRIDPEDIDVTFKDVAGSEEDMQEIQEIVDFLKNAEQYAKVKAKIPRGILLSGPPGTGKTLVCKAIAKEAGIPFYSSSGSEFEEMLVGTGASRIRSMFEEARQETQAIIFIDEIDAVGGHRGNGSGSNSKEQTLNQLLVEMDGFEGSGGVIIIGATNRIESLDPALLRPGRFDRIVTLGLPDLDSRMKIINIHLSKIISDVSESNTLFLAKGTPGFSGADIAKLVNEGAIFAARDHRDVVGINDLDRAKDKVMMGHESPKKMNPSEIRLTAIHEAGHAIVGHLSPEHDEVYKVSIVPRSRSLGVTMFLPDVESHNYSKRKLDGILTTLLAGRAAEEVVYGKEFVTTGASNDLTRATSICRNMVTKWGLSDVGLTAHDYDRRRDYSEAMGNLIDKEVDMILRRSYNTAIELLIQNKDILEKMADVLVERETINREEVIELLERRHE
jgi:cell division protease FtsH